jgi:hypothetical protein
MCLAVGVFFFAGQQILDWTFVSLYSLLAIVASSGLHAIFFYILTQPTLTVMLLSLYHANLALSLPSSSSSSSSSSFTKASLPSSDPHSIRLLFPDLFAFETYLKTREGGSAFLAFCRLELRVEEILAWQLLRRFRQAKKRHYKATAIRMYHHMFVQCAPLTCPTMDKWRKMYHERLGHTEVSWITPKPVSKKVALTLFEPVEADLLQTLYTQVAPRFEAHVVGGGTSFDLASRRKIKPHHPIYIHP